MVLKQWNHAFVSHVCLFILKTFFLNSVLQMGNTKVFLRAGQMAELDARRTEILASAAKRIQRQIQTYLIRKEFITIRKATIHMQKHWRGYPSCIRLLHVTSLHMKSQYNQIRNLHTATACGIPRGTPFLFLVICRFLCFIIKCKHLVCQKENMKKEKES